MLAGNDTGAVQVSLETDLRTPIAVREHFKIVKSTLTAIEVLEWICSVDVRHGRNELQTREIDSGHERKSLAN
jgi:hypothetical protein